MTDCSIRTRRLLGCVAVLALIASCNDTPSPNKTTPAATQSSDALTSPDYASHIQPLFDNRCIACHGCLGSPCNVKLSSFRGVDRGGFGKNPYSTHFEDYPRTGMDVVPTTADWRKRGFYPVIERGGMTNRTALDRCSMSS